MVDIGKSLQVVNQQMFIIASQPHTKLRDRTQNLPISPIPTIGSCSMPLSAIAKQRRLR
jgi:hypothetical protein